MRPTIRIGSLTATTRYRQESRKRCAARFWSTPRSRPTPVFRRTPEGSCPQKQRRETIMKLPRRRFLHLTAAAAALPALSRFAQAQSYPIKPIKLVLPFTPGSPNDVLARLVTPALSSHLGQPVVIENRPGGGTSIATRAVMTADPDGYTLLWSNSPSHFIAPSVSKTYTYDPLKDFT